MLTGWFARLFFVLVVALAVAGVMSGTACTRWGHPGAVPPSITPLSSIYVNPVTGSDSTGNGSMTSPYKTLTKAVTVLASAPSLSPTGVTIYLASGNYVVANGEKFPIVVPTGVTIMGTAYGTGPKTGTFINGAGEDTLLEQLLHTPPHSAYTTLEIESSASVSLTQIYVGASNLSLPSSRAEYASLDNLGTVSGSLSSFGSGVVSRQPNISGVFVPGGSFTCSSCGLRGNDVGIAAFSVPVVTSSPSSVVPSVTLSRTTTGSVIVAKEADIATDGSPNVTTSNETFERARYAYTDSFTRFVLTTVRGTVDFGGGAANSPGGNNFIGARTSEIYVTRRSETVSALGNTWNPREQGANRSGLYRRNFTFASGASGKNVTILRDALGSTVGVGPIPVPTPTPSVSPSVSPTSSATSSPT